MGTTLTVKTYDVDYPDVSAKAQTREEALAEISVPDGYDVVDYDVEEGQNPIRTPLKNVFEALDFSRASSFEVELVIGCVADGDRKFVGWGDNPRFSSYHDDNTLRVVIDDLEIICELEEAE
jgi:hypothetical protein